MGFSGFFCDSRYELLRKIEIAVSRVLLSRKDKGKGCGRFKVPCNQARCQARSPCRSGCGLYSRDKIWLATELLQNFPPKTGYFDNARLTDERALT